MASDNMDCRSTYLEVSSVDKSMMDLDSSSIGDYPREVFAIGDEGSAAGNNNQPPLMTTTAVQNPNGIQDLVSPDNHLGTQCFRYVVA